MKDSFMTLSKKKSIYQRKLFYKENLYKNFKNNKYILVYYVNNMKISDWNNLQDELKSKRIQVESQRIRNNSTFEFLKSSKLHDKICSFDGPVCVFFFNEFADCFALLNSIEKSKVFASKFLALGLFSDDRFYDNVKLEELKSLDSSVYYKLFNQLHFLSI
jgi:ribosomal protein L10